LISSFKALEAGNHFRQEGAEIQRRGTFFYCAVGNEGRVIMLANRAPKLGVAVTVCPIVNRDFKSACFLISNNLNWR
jgi:hypothetical protein